VAIHGLAAFTGSHAVFEEMLLALVADGDGHAGDGIGLHHRFNGSIDGLVQLG